MVPDAFSLPVVVNSATYSSAAIVVLVAALASALVVRRRVDKLDLVGVLKTRD
jgi:putative ABC transport system permease protein